MKKLTRIIIFAALAACFVPAMATEAREAAHAPVVAPTAVPAAAATPAHAVAVAPTPAPAPVAASAVVSTSTASAAPAAEEPKKGFFARWVSPLANIRVSSFFGALRGKRAHGGVDFSTPMNTPVMATGPGVVVASTNRYDGDRKYGEVVVIEHLNGFRSLYAHLNKRSVNVGDEVSAGQAIGLSGATGHSTGPHLHLEAFENGKRVDPRNLLAGLEEGALQSALKARQFKGENLIFTAPKSKAAATTSKGYKRAKPAPERTRATAAKRPKAKSTTSRKTAARSKKR